MRELTGHQTRAQNLLRQAEFSYRTLSEAQELALLLADISKGPDRTYSGFIELLLNAVEHDNVGIA